MKQDKYLRYVIFIFPFLFFWTGSKIELPKFSNDPNYVYLVNAAMLCDGKGVGYIDHPGTTVMQVAASVIAVKHIFSNGESLSVAEHVFTDPHSFVLAIRNVFLVLNTLILLLLGWVAFRKTKSVWAALLLQASPFVTVNSLDHVWTKISPAPVLFFITAVFVIVLLYFFADENKLRWKYAIAFSLTVGAGIVTKATFVPLAVLPFIVLPTLKRKLAYAFGILPAFVLFSIPIIPEYENMYYWFRDLSSHSGIYGHGSRGFIDWQTYLPNMAKIMVNNPVFALVFIAGTVKVVLSIIKSWREKTKIVENTQILSGLVAASGAGILLVAKHYHSNHYLIPELLLTGITIFFIARSLEETMFPRIIKKGTLPFLVILLIIFLGWKQPSKIKYINQGYMATNLEMDSTRAMLDESYPGYTRIYYYPNSLNRFSALNFGNVYSKQKMLPVLREIYGDVYFYNHISKTFMNWTTEVFPEDLIASYGKKILLVGGPIDNGSLNEIAGKGLPLNNIYKGRLQVIHVLDTARIGSLSGEERSSLGQAEVFDVDNVSGDGQVYLGSKGGKIDVNGTRSQVVLPYSGEFSVKMDQNTAYAMEYRLKDLQKGQDYEISVWRSPGKNALLVAASEDAKTLYKAQAQAARTNSEGWQLLKIKFTVPAQLQNKWVKVYLWNKNNEVVYFDDLAIIKK